jgi:hypothetical protein
MNTMHGDAFCYDFDGNPVWKKWYGYEMTRGEAITSPILVGDLLIMRGRMPEKPGGKPKRHCWMAVNKKNGEIVWQTPKHGGRSYTDASPTHHRLAIGGDESQQLDVLWCPTGQVLRVSDGKELASELGCQGNGRPWGVQGDILVIKNGSSDGGRGKAQTWDEGIVAFRLKADSQDKVTGEKLWFKDGRRLPGRFTVKDNVVYGVSRKEAFAFNLLTGQQLSKAGFPRHAERTHHLTAVAGGYLFGLSHSNDCVVISLGPDGRRLSTVALNRLGERRYRSYDFFNEGAQPFFSGNRIFIRSYTDVYCLGNPNQPMRLSSAHKGDGAAGSSRTTASSSSRRRAGPRGAAARRQRPSRAASGSSQKVDRDALLKSLVKMTKGGRKPSFYLSTMRTRARVVSATRDGRLKLSARGMMLSFDLDQLPEKDVKQIAEAID